MKKLVLVVAAFFIIGGMTSCKKDYTCECSYNGSVVGTYTYHTTKSKAKDACNSAASSGGSTWKCEIK